MNELIRVLETIIADFEGTDAEDFCYLMITNAEDAKRAIEQAREVL